MGMLLVGIPFALALPTSRVSQLAMGMLLVGIPLALALSTSRVTVGIFVEGFCCWTLSALVSSASPVVDVSGVCCELINAIAFVLSCLCTFKAVS